MFNTKDFILLAALAFANGVNALNAHRHGHQHLHAKRDLKTDYVTVTDWVTVTVWDGENSVTSTAAASPAVFVAAAHTQVASEHYAPLAVDSSSTTSPAPAPPVQSSTVAAPPPPSSSAPPPPPPPSSSPAAPPTTLTTSVKAASPAPVVNAAASVSVHVSSSPASSPASYPSSGSGGLKRGLAYNDPSLLSGFVQSGSKVSWAYNWGQTRDFQIDVEFVPMLWGPGSDHSQSWNSNANKAIASGSKCLLSFNEPDNAGQANLSPAAAKAGHIQYMNPFSGKARIGAPAITNSNQNGEGISWLKEFVSVCAGQCAFDFVPIHWYNNPDTTEFLNHLLDVHAVVPDKPVWITEFAPFGSDDQINDFLQVVLDKLDNDPKYSFVERYSYFMVSPGSLVSSGTALSVYGKTYAYA
ncbi:hypothetical protein VTK73DRAFT_28 [Phialemonium thermophilum]|uniref:Asl1-like glycosyl hydrolase catalytic domain-containing protein n=1 Tax=Phialemonium thermophilum TaxID=223376 RepID=A0ABR3Y7P6_9PEZI